MHIDIGAADREEAEALVRVGDPVVIAAEPMPVAGDRLVSRSMDNRLGAYVALESLRRCAEGKGPGGSLRRRRRRAGGDRPLRRPHRRLPGPPRHRDRRRRHPRHRRARGRREGDRQPPASAPARRSAAAPPSRPRSSSCWSRPPRRRGSSTRSAPAAAAPAPTPTSCRSPAPGSRPALVSIPLRYMHSPVEMVDLARRRGDRRSCSPPSARGSAATGTSAADAAELGLVVVDDRRGRGRRPWPRRAPRRRGRAGRRCRRRPARRRRRRC